MNNYKLEIQDFHKIIETSSKKLYESTLGLEYRKDLLPPVILSGIKTEANKLYEALDAIDIHVKHSA